MKSGIFLLWIFVLCNVKAGVVELNSKTFEKVTGAFQYSLVKFFRPQDGRPRLGQRRGIRRIRF